MAFCRNCGNQLGEGASFCEKCGQRIEIAPTIHHEIDSQKLIGNIIFFTYHIIYFFSFLIVL